MTTKHGVGALKRHEVKVSGVVFMLFCLVSAGAFGIEEMIPEAGPGLTIAMLIIIPIIWAWPLSNMVSECGSLIPSEGGIYAWTRQAFGEFWGFQAGWMGTVSTYITNGTYVSLVGGYLTQIVPMTPTALVVFKVLVIALFTFINLKGIHIVDRVSTALSLIIVAAFALIAIVGFVNWQTSPFEPFIAPGVDALSGAGSSLCICLWMYCGYECISNLAGELKDPQVIHRGLKIVMPLIALGYILPTMAGLACMPEGSWVNWAVDGGDGGSIGYASVLTQNLGAVWGAIFLVVSIVAQCAIFNMYLASGSRGFFVLSDDGMAPKVFRRVSKKRKVPFVGILSLAFVTVITCQGSFTLLVTAEMVFLIGLYILLAASTLKLRKYFPVEERRKKNLFIMGGGKLGLAYFCGLPIVIALAALLVNGTDYLALGLLGICTGPVAYFVFKRAYGGKPVSEDADVPLIRADQNAIDRYYVALEKKKSPLDKKFRLGDGDVFNLGLFASLAGGIAFLGQFWLRWYEITYGEWTPDDYVAFQNSIPFVMDCLLWIGLAMMLVGITTMLVARFGFKKEAVDTARAA